MRTRTSRIALALALLVTLDGCVAAVIPVLAGAAGARSQMKNKTAAAPRATEATPALIGAVSAAPVATAVAVPAPTLAPAIASAPQTVRTAAMGPPAPSPFEDAAAPPREPYRAPVSDKPGVAAASPLAPVRKAAASPPPRVARAPAPRPVTAKPEAPVAAPLLQPAPPPKRVRGAYTDFAQYALAQAQPMSGGAARSSVVYDPASSLEAPRYLACDQLAPAVLIDLDPATGAFSPARAGGAAPGLGDALVAVRAAGLVVLWATDLPVTLAPEVYRTLRASGLDPEGTDRLLLNRTSDERKELRKRAAARDYCIVAVAGDKRGDFAELYDYLRDPAAAAALEPRFGAGWFMVPPALGAN